MTRIRITIIALIIASAIVLFGCGSSDSSEDVAQDTSTQIEDIVSPYGAHDYASLYFRDIEKEYKDAGFTDVRVMPVKDLDADNEGNYGNVKDVLINGKKDYQKGDHYSPDAVVLIHYHSYKEKEETDDSVSVEETSTPNEPKIIILENDWFSFRFNNIKIKNKDGWDLLCLDVTFEDKGMSSSEVSNEFRLGDLDLQDYFVISQTGWVPYNDDKRFDRCDLVKVKMGKKTWTEDDSYVCKIKVPLHVKRDIHFEYCLENLKNDVTMNLVKYGEPEKMVFRIEGDTLVLL